MTVVVPQIPDLKIFDYFQSSLKYIMFNTTGGSSNKFITNKTVSSSLYRATEIKSSNGFRQPDLIEATKGEKDLILSGHFESPVTVDFWPCL